MGLRTWLGIKRRTRPEIDPAFAQWFSSKQFTRDVTSNKFPVWSQILGPRREGIRSILEIGSFEGRSALFFLNFIPGAKITCIDPFDGRFAECEERFDRNLAEFSDRLEKIKSRSVPALDELAREGRIFDFVFIDGSHDGDDVLLDTVLTWRLLRHDGVIAWDDYRWKRHHYRPRPAIDAFLRLRRGELQVLHRGEQLIAVRTK